MRARRGMRRSEPETVASLLPALVARLGGQDRAREHRAFEAYELAAGEVLRERTRAERLRGATLWVRASSSAVAHEVTLLRGEILGKMTVALGAELVTELRTRVGPLQARLPR